MRKKFVDNLRWICILLLFPYHTCRVFSSNDGFYIQGSQNNVMTAFVYFCIPWFMPLLFALAGMSTAYALKRRSVSQYVSERVKKLLIPFAAGFILLIPLQTYFANKFYNGFDGSIVEQYRLFFTKITDLSGYDGGMTPGHLWFILYLFVISLLALIPIILIRKNDGMTNKINIVGLLLFAVLLYGMNYVGNLGGKSIGKYFTLFLIGYYVLSEDKILEIVKKCRFFLLCIWIVPEAAYVILNMGYGRNIIALEILSGWTAILAMLGFGQVVLDFSNRFTKYMASSSFALYIFHQTVLVTIAYYVLKWKISEWAMAVIILSGTLLVTFAAHETVRRIPGIRYLFGMKGIGHGGKKN